MLVQLNPPLPLQTPKGEGLAHVLIDYGFEFDLVWVVFLNDTGQVWAFPNPEVRASKNITAGRSSPERLASAAPLRRPGPASVSGP